MESQKKRGGFADWLADLSDGMTALLEGIGDAISGGESSAGDAGGYDSGSDAGACDGGGCDGGGE